MRFLLIFLAITYSSVGLAKHKLSNQQLLQEIKEAKHDSIRCKNYYQLAKNYLRVSADSCMQFGKIALELAIKLDSKKYQGECYSILGAREKHNGNYNEAIKLHLKALAIKEANKDIQGMSISNNDIGIVYKNMERYKEALPYYQKSNQYASQCDDIRAVSMTFSNIGTIYSALNILDSTKYYYDTALAVAYKINDTGSIVNALSNLGEYYGNQGNAAKAKECFEKSLVIDRASGDKYGIVLDQVNLANLYMGAQELDKAMASFNEAEKIAIEEKLNKELIGVYAGQYSLYKKLGQYPKAITYLEKQQQLKDSILNEETNKQVSELGAKYETVKKEKTIAEQEQKLSRQQYLLFGGLLLFLLLGLVAYFRYRKLKAEEEMKLKEVVMEQQLLSTKSVLEAEEKERQRIASELHDGVGQLMTAAKMNLASMEPELTLSEDKKITFNKIMDLVTESGKEVRDVAHNLMPNVLLKKGLSNAVQEFLNKIDAKVIKVNLHAEGINTSIDANVEAVLYRVIQECVNNVIKHSKASHLDIGITMDTEGISVSIEDNGVGFDIQNIKSDGIGLANTRSRIEFLKGQLDIDSSLGKGTLIAIFVPNT